jgi:two-component system CheB/CheR fusion protein
MSIVALETGFLFPLQSGLAICPDEPRGETCVGCSLVREREMLAHQLSSWREAAASHFLQITPREGQVLQLVLAGCPSKNIAADLGISQRTVENHRASIMKKTRTKSLAALARLAFAAGWSGVAMQSQ